LPQFQSFFDQAIKSEGIYMAYFSLAETALMVGLSADTIRRRCRSGKIKHVRQMPYAKILIPQKELEQLQEKMATNKEMFKC
jgi:predicted site-specific integrase-resolvase